MPGQAQTGRHSPGHMAFGWRGWRWTPSCGCPVLPELLCAAPPQPLALSCLHCGLDQPCPGAGAEGLLCLPRGAAAGSSPDLGTCPMSRWLVLSQAAVWARPRPSLPGGAAGSGGGPGGEGKGQAARCSACHRGTPPGGLLGGGIWVGSRGDMVAAGSGPRRTPWAETGLHPGVGLPCSRRLQLGGDGAPEPGRPQGARLSSREGHCLPGRPCRELSRARRFWVWMVPGGAWPACHPACPSPGSW